MRKIAAVTIVIAVSSQNEPSTGAPSSKWGTSIATSAMRTPRKTSPKTTNLGTIVFPNHTYPLRPNFSFTT